MITMYMVTHTVIGQFFCFFNFYCISLDKSVLPDISSDKINI